MKSFTLCILIYKLLHEYAIILFYPVEEKSFCKRLIEDMDINNH